MARLIVVWQRPVDTEAFDRHYFGVHVPLAKKLPGLRKYEVSKGPIVALNGAKDPYLISILHFDDLASLKTAFASDIGRACAEDRKALARDENVQTLLFDVHEV